MRPKNKFVLKPYLSGGDEILEPIWREVIENKFNDLYRMAAETTEDPAIIAYYMEQLLLSIGYEVDIPSKHGKIKERKE